MKFSADFIEKVRESNDIVDVISQHVQLKRAGSSYRGLCPFPGHAEKTPSFYVSDVKQVYHCFGCRKSGNLFTFVMDYNGLSFPDAVVFMAERAGIALPEMEKSKDTSKEDAEKKLLFKVNKYVGSYFHKKLVSKSADHGVQKYISKRGLTSEIIEEFKLGYSENVWQGLVNTLKAGKAPLPAAEKLGLIKNKKGGEHFDIFRNRLMFPIFSTSGNVLGFGGRSIDDSQPKYLNSPESPIFNKGRTLYGVNVTAKYIRASQEVIVVEGYMDLISLYQIGIKNVVATLGTAFTLEHAKAIHKLCGKAVVLFDSDSAGLEAADRSLMFLTEAGVLSRCLVLTEAKDPDEYGRIHGVKKLQKLIDEAPDHFTVFLNRKMAHYKGRSTDKREVLELIQPVLDRVKDQQLRSLYLQEVADRLNLDTQMLARAKSGGFTQPAVNTREKQIMKKPVDLPKDEKLLVQFMLVDKKYLKLVQEAGVISSFISADARMLANRIVERYCQNPNDFDKLAASLLGENTEEVQILKDSFSIFAQDRPENKEEEEKMVADCLESVKQKNLKQRSTEILNSLKSTDKDSDLTLAKLKDFLEIAKEQKGPQRR